MRHEHPVETPHWIGRMPTRLASVPPSDTPSPTRPRRGVSTEGSALFQGHLRAESTRLPVWDYRSNGYYFVTICTKDRAPVLGEIFDASVQLSTIGEIVATEWLGIAIRRRDVALDQWVVMPNHIHGIVIIRRERGVETPQRGRDQNPIHDDAASTDDPGVQPILRGVSTRVAPSRLLAGSLGAIIGQFKSRATKRAWQAGFLDFGWQPRFYDHIIRDDRSLDRIRQYIIDNPAKWDPHEATPENLWM